MAVTNAAADEQNGRPCLLARPSPFAADLQGGNAWSKASRSSPAYPQVPDAVKLPFPCVRGRRVQVRISRACLEYDYWMRPAVQ